VIAWLDGEPASSLPLQSRGVLLGDAVFETMRAYAGRPFALDAHLDRLERSAAWARLRPNAPRETFARECVRAAEIVGDAAVRVFVLRGARGDGPLDSQPTHRVILAEPLDPGSSLSERGASACVLPHASFGTGESAHAKYARYLPRLLARDEARARGCDDALLSDESGRVVEAATGSVFAVVGDQLVTASVLEGITRMHVLELARNLRIDCALRPLEARDVERASELFVTSSLREIVPVVRLDGRAIGEGTPGEKTRALLRAYRELTGA
jgi:branched-chain amino acid aminotransferase